MGEPEVSRKKDSNVLEALSRLFDAKLASLNSSDSVEKINSLFSSDVENNRITRPLAGQPAPPLYNDCLSRNKV